MNPFRNTLWLSIGDLIAKVFNFLAIVYLARILGVAGYGVIEFAITILTYFTLFADGGLEIWSTRETARVGHSTSLVANTTSLRLILAVLAFGLILLLLPIFPDYPDLTPVLTILGMTLIAQAVNLKWVFIGQEKMRLAAFGLVMGQIFFAGAMFVFIKMPEQLVGVAIIWLLSEVIAALYFAGLYLSIHRSGFSIPRFKQIGGVVKPALTIGMMQAFGIINYNFDSLLLGFLSGAEQVGWYRAGYKPITAALGIPLTYFAGLLPAFSRAYAQNYNSFLDLFHRALHLTIIFALPIGIGGVFLAQPIILLLYGEEYSQSILVVKILSWSAMLVVVRSTLRHGLLAAGRQDLALRSAAIAVCINIFLNIILIPSYGMVGAAFTTVFSDLIWFLLLFFDFSRIIDRIGWSDFFIRPLVAGAAMAAVFFLVQQIFWPIQIILAGVTYFVVLMILGEPEIKSWIRLLRLNNN